MSAVAPTDDLVREARRLRFREAAVETRFNDERCEHSRFRQRALSAVAIVVVAAIGWNSAILSARLAPEFIRLDLHHRFFVVVPAWLVVFGLTFLPADRRRAEWVNLAMTIVACWGLALSTWHHSWFFPRGNWSNSLVLNPLAVLLVSAFALPFRFRHVAVAVGASLGGTMLWCALTMPVARAYDLKIVGLSYVGIGLCVLVMSWWREAGDRTMFAQREHARRLAAELAVANQRLVKLSEEQAEFMTIAAHDLRAPLAVVQGFAELLESGLVAEPAQRQEMVTEIRRQTARMLGLVTDYLGAHAAEGRAAEARRERMDLAAVLRETAARHGPAAEAKQQALTCEAAAAVWVEADAAMLGQVLDNFVTNAVKFSPAGAPIRLGVERGEGKWRALITDAGPGVAPEERGALFRKFGRTSARPTGGETSHGLGLAVAARLAEAMGGRVGCEAAPTRGAVFWVELPAVA